MSVNVDMTDRLIAPADKPLWQYDYGQTVSIEHTDIPDGTIAVHFEAKHAEGAIVTSGTAVDGTVTATIPDQLLALPMVWNYTIMCYVFVIGENSGTTRYTAILEVAHRGEQTDEEPTPAQQSAWDQAMADLAQYQEDIDAALDEIVIVSDEQPTSTHNKLWIDGDSEEEYEVPTIDELNEVQRQVDVLNEGGLNIKDEVIAEDIQNWLDEHPEATTTVEDDSVTAIKLKKNQFEPVNIMAFGAKNDGSADCSAIINRYTADYVLYFPVGVYRLDAPISIKKSIIGACAPRMNGTGSVLKANFTNDYMVKVIDVNDGIGICVENIALDCDSKANGLLYNPAWRPPIKIKNISVWNFYTKGIYIAPQHSVSRCAMLSDISMTGGSENSAVGIEFNSYSVDSSLDHFFIMYCQKGIIARAGGCRFHNGHIYVGRPGLADLDTYYNNSICVEAYGDCTASDLYLDSALQGWVQRQGTSMLSNIFVYYDAFADSATNKSATIIRAVDNACKVLVSNLFVDGNRSLIGTLASTNVIVDKLSTGFTALSSIDNTYSYGQMPVILGKYLKRSYTDYIADLTLGVVAVVLTNSAKGSCCLRLSRNELYGDVIIKKDENTITVTGKRAYGLGDFGVWYSIVGNYVYLWTYRYEYTDVDVLFSTVTRSGYIAPLDFDALPKWSHPTQSDTTGLTQITFTS